MNEKYKILSLDGGGSWAILQVLALKNIFSLKYPNREIKGHEVLRHFDLVIANSGGSMVLAGLACNWSFNEIISLFENKSVRESIFKKLNFKLRYFPTNFMSLAGIKSIGTRYSTTSKKQALEELLLINNETKLNDFTLSELPTIIGKESLEIIITTFDIINKRAKLFRSNEKSKARAEIIANIDHFEQVSLVGAVHGASNAPVNYFDFPAVLVPKIKGIKNTRRRYLWDGALGGFNNPVMVGITEALANNVDRKAIHVISIGTGSKLVSDEDSDNFRDEYYTCLLGKRVVRNIDGHIDWQKTKRKIGLFFRLFKGAKFYSSTISNLSQSILFEPQTWASYSAYISLFSGKDDPSNDKRFLRLSPQIIKNNNSNELINKLYNLDMDVTEQSEIELLKSCFEDWKNGNLKNEPVQWTKTINGEYIFAKGHQTFAKAMNDLDWI
ncbi:patatin-like phospholipase family protein [Formosa haliotis]|uniref:patatin-like phospholipase family protein n=1 Tax=Formosa haliotis TaxID=1555194 RepID=UPI0008247839|nr:patatin-like phospholipase family protein [Formosa haliotis]